tara:strand:+ start:96 stop:287 length:192 start_codon:yes stop_codon:yes gene_type:complete
MKGLFRAVFDKEAYFPKDQFFIKYFKDFEKLEPYEKCAIIEEIQFHLQKEYDRNAKIYNQQIG